MDDVAIADQLIPIKFVCGIKVTEVVARRR